MVRPRGRSARFAALLAAVVTVVVCAFDVPPAGAQENSRAARLARVARINQRRDALAAQLAQLKAQLPTRRAASNSLRLRTEAPGYTLARAPQERAKLLDEAADGARALAETAGKLAAAASEDLALQLELGDIIADAQREAGVLSDDKKRADAAKRAREYVAALRDKAKVAGPRALQAERVRVDDLVSRWRATQKDAEQLAARFRGELRFAQVVPTPGTPLASQKKAGQPIEACKARQVDWKNVTITVAGHAMKLRDGRGPVEPPVSGYGTRVTVKQVEFLDSNADVREEALLLVEREERGAPPEKRARVADVLYVFESALDCSLRRRAEVVLGSGGGQGKAVRGGYDYTARDGSLHAFRWESGLLEERAATTTQTASLD